MQAARAVAGPICTQITKTRCKSW